MTHNQLKFELKQLGFRRWHITERMLSASMPEQASGVVIRISANPIEIAVVRMYLERIWPADIGLYVDRLPFWKCWLKWKQWDRLTSQGVIKD